MTTALDRTAQVIKKVSDGVISLSTLFRELEKPAVAPTLAPVVPAAVEITDEQRAAIEALVPTIEKAVTPEERRPLTDQEKVSLLDERKLLDEIETLIKERKEAMRDIVFNHLDVVAEKTVEDIRLATEVAQDHPDLLTKIAASVGLKPEDLIEEVDSIELPLDSKHAHYVLKGEVPVKGRSQLFRRELRTTAPQLTAEGLKALTKISSGFTHQDYLDCTYPDRALDEARLMMWLRKNPDKASLLSQALIPGSTTAALHVRKA